MTQTEQFFLEALRASLRGETAFREDMRPEDWQELFRLSDIHKVTPLVFEAVYASAGPESEVLFSELRKQVRGQIIGQTLRTGEFLRLYAALNGAGFHPLVVKGIVCRSLYIRPDDRSSADEDILIPEPEWENCIRFLESWGMHPRGEADPSAHEIGWLRGPLYIELHRTLFSDEITAFRDMNRLLAGVHENAEDYPAENGSVLVRSLSPQEHLLYLLLHAYKHFIHSGFGLRQVCDIGLWAEKYGGRVDWELLWEQCRSTHTLGFSASVLRLAEERLGVRLALPAAWREAASDPEPMLADILSAGIYGSSNASRQHSATVTFNAVEADRQQKKSSALNSVFPPREKLLRDYPELREHPGRLPLAWGKRLWRYARETARQENNSASDSLRIARERKELLRFYGIID